MTFGKRLARLRCARGMSAALLSRMVSKGNTAVYSWESERKRNPRFENVVRLSEILRVPLSAFACDETCERCVEMIEKGRL